MNNYKFCYIKNLQIVELSSTFPTNFIFRPDYNYLAIHVKNDLYFYWQPSFNSYCIVKSQQVENEKIIHALPTHMILQYEKCLNDQFDKRIEEIVNE